MSMATTPSASGTPGWRVISQSEVTRPGPGTNVTRGVVVTFQLDSGQQGTVFVPDNAYNPDNVRQAISYQAKLMHDIGNLSS